MEITAQEMIELNDLASHVRLATGLPLVDAIANMIDARDSHGVSPREYVNNRIYLIPAARLGELKLRNRFVLLTAKERKIPYARALATMFDIRTRFGITFREFTQHKLYTYSSEQDLMGAVRRLIAREGKHILQVCHETGWAPSKAEEKMRAAKKKWPTIDFRKYAGYGFFGQTDEEISERVRNWTVTADANRAKVMEATGWSPAEVRAHMTRFQMVYDIIPAYYMCYRGWELSDEQIDGYARQKLSERLSNKYNIKSDTDLLGQKDVFDQVYAEYVNRKFWVNKQNASLESFLEFAEGLGEAFCKPLRSGGGLGTFKLNLAVDRHSLVETYQDLMSKPLVLVEESVKQHDDLNEFYPNSVNTIRVVTLQDEDGVHIISTGVRFGSDGITDNFSADGFVCDVDKESGVILTPAVNKKGIVAEAHPYSGKVFVGAKIPHWDKVISAATDAMSVLSGVNYVGWDVAVGPNGVSLIEGNSMPDLVLVQAPYAPTKVGKRYLFDPFLNREGKYPAVASGLDLKEIEAQSADSSTSEDRRDNGENEFEFETTDGEATILKFVGNGDNVVVPSEVGGAPVRRIGERAFADCETLKSVRLPEGLAEIGPGAFAGDSQLAQINFPDSVAVIGAKAFENCVSLVDLELPDQLLVLEEGVFAGAKSLVEVCLPYGLKRIEREAFKNCESLVSTYYYSKRGISAVMVTDRELREDALPNEIEFIGEGAFSFCRSLERVDVPYLVREINDRTFLGCSSLVHMGLHNRVVSIGKRSFRGCVKLKELQVPFGCTTFGKEAFSQKTRIRSGKGAPVVAFAEEAGFRWKGYSSRGLKLNSQFIPGAKKPDSESAFYTPEEADALITRYELRHPSYVAVTRDSEPEIGEIPSSRFTLENGLYRGKSNESGRARLMFVGDLMARYRQQNAAKTGANFQFDFSFQYVKGLFAQADFVAGNLESTISESAPYTVEREHVNARPHLNAPKSLLGAVRRAGFDAVTNAQNHVYDSGTLGVLETLNAANQSELLHTGAFVSNEDPRSLVVDLNGIKVGLVAYLDSARQMMKKANYTKAGREVMFPYFDADKIQSDIRGARELGAEFVVAFCHWGREYTTEITDRQREFAQMVVDAGADYIVGAHSHCIQPYEVLQSEDGRQVPCLWSAGNFISDINLMPPITRDTLIVDLKLERDEAGAVVLAGDNYHPCRIMNLSDGDGRNYAVVPTSHRFDGTELNRTLDEAEARIIEVVGAEAKPVGR